MKKYGSWGEGVRAEYKAPEYLLDNLFNFCDTGDLQRERDARPFTHTAMERRLA